MKKKYIAPEICVCMICTSQMLANSDIMQFSDEDADDTLDML